MEAKKEKRAHTPGPWEKATIGIGTNSKQVVWLGENTGKQVQVIGTGRDHANARLIAAAPEMLEMCKLFEECMETIDGKDGYDASYELAKVREVLAKVEGGEG
jgi:hypothetical protein